MKHIAERKWKRQNPWIEGFAEIKKERGGQRKR